MKKKKQSPFGLIIILLVIAAAFLLVKHFHIKNFQIIKPEVLYVSGQPRGMDYTRLLYKYHIATIVNVRSASEHREKNWYNEEITWVRNNGVKYIELPIERDNYFPDKQTQGNFLDIMADKENLPVLLHGSGGEKRIPMLTAVWLIKSQELSVEETLKIVDRINDDRKITSDEEKFISSLASLISAGS
ncbi:MAG: phosphatase domain-containing protein [Planctomycetota bacterium]|jgi:protein tyrosine/serine phosphatase